MKTGEAKSIPYPLPKTTVTGHFLFCTPRLRYKDRESRFEPDAQRSNAKIVYLDARQRLPTKEKTILPVLRPHSLSKIHRNQKQPGIRTAKIINSKLPACTGNISVRTAIFAGGLEIIHFSYAHRFGHCPKLLSCTLSRTAYRKYSATDVSGFRTDSARRLFDRRQP